ncbi:Histone-lysine N-methyltransferase ATXR4 [Apostasia shenzhenica]|uniref:Histone-lysine N-methyltransferase ATXR4 n=1 Tax=Apostasia shenzhenica TaxID=1088818 RepID=A0A2I0ADK1_9ASPA|nr:Histone-lysine N-methyltransferase ATXR4 [Apostasia shenzhenica]
MMFSGGYATVRRRSLLEARRLFRHHVSPFTRAGAAGPSFSISSTVTETSGAELGPPVKVSITHSAGRGVFATRKIAAGDLIHTAKPIVTHPSLGVAGRVCYHCLRWLGKDTSSGNISASYFCSQQCREESEGFFQVESIADWSVYHDHCRIFELGS